MEPSSNSRRLTGALEHLPERRQQLESQLETAAPWDPHATAIDLFIDSQTPNGGSFLGGLAGDGPTLVYGRTVERCDDPGGNNCQRLDAVGGVVLVTGQNQTATVPGIPPPVLVAFSAHDPQSSVQISQGLVAVAPAETPVTTDLGSAPRVRQNGPVEVLQLLGGVAHLETRVAPVGTVRAIALDFHQLAVLVERADGTKAIERYEPRRGTSDRHDDCAENDGVRAQHQHRRDRLPGRVQDLSGFCRQGDSEARLEGQRDADRPLDRG